MCFKNRGVTSKRNGLWLVGGAGGSRLALLLAPARRATRRTRARRRTRAPV